MTFPEYDEFGNRREEPEPDVPEAFREFIEKGGIFPGYAEAFPEEDATFNLTRKVNDIITDILMDVKANLDNDGYRLMRSMQLPSGKTGYMVREDELFDLLRQTAARVWLAARQMSPSDDDELWSF